MFEPCLRWAGDWLSAISDMMENSSRSGKRRSRKRRQTFGSSGGGQRKSSHYDAAREHDLEGIVAGRFRVLERNFSRAAKCGVVCARAGERLFGRAGAPRLQRDAAERDPRL